MAAVTVRSDFGAQENKICRCFCFPPIYLLWSDGTECYDLSFLNVEFKPDFLLLSFTINLPWSDGTRCHDLSFLNVEFKPGFSLSSFTFIKRIYSSSSLSAIRVVSSAYLRFLVFLSATLIPACALSNLAFHMMYSAYKLNNQDNNTQP